MNKSTLIILLFVLLLSACKAVWGFDSHVPYRTVNESRNLGTSGDFTRFKYGTTDSILATCWFHSDRIQNRTVLETGVWLTKEQEEQLEGKKMEFVSSNMGPLDLESYKNSGENRRYTFIKNLDSLDRISMMNLVTNDTVRLYVGEEAYMFLSERRRKLIE